MSRHPSFGPLNAEEIAKSIDAPAGEFARRIQKIDPLWGRSYSEGQVRTFEVTVQRDVAEIERAKVQIEATSIEEAEKFVDLMDWDKFKWSHYSMGDEDNHEIINCKPL